MFRYNEAKDLAKNLEKQANKVQAEAEDAGNEALKIFANLTSLPPFDTKALEVSAGVGGNAVVARAGFQRVRCVCACGVRMRPTRSRRRRRTWTS